jgi:type VI secretion system secreted protein Hcp
VALNMFLQLDQIVGDSADPNHTGQMDVLAYSWGVSHSPPSGTTSSKPAIQDISATIYEGSHSVQLYRACALGSVIKGGLLTVYRSATPTVPFDEFRITGVRVTSLSGGGSGGEDRLTQNVTLHFATVQYTVTEPPAVPVAFGYNITKNTPF